MAQENELISQDEVERLLQQAGAETRGGAQERPGDPRPTGPEAQTVAQAATPRRSDSPPLSAAGEAANTLGSEDLERLAPQPGKSAAPKSATPKDKALQPLMPGEGELPPPDVEYLLHQAEQALASVNAPAEALPHGVSAFRFQEFSGAAPSTDNTTLELIRDVELDLRIELGRTQMYLQDVLKLRKGSVVPLDKLAGDPVDIFVNGRLVARGEVLVLNENFCVRVAELVAPEPSGE
jgi:flagellar motor switch protein FliN/FliY